VDTASLGNVNSGNSSFVNWIFLNVLAVEMQLAIDHFDLLRIYVEENLAENIVDILDQLSAAVAAVELLASVRETAYGFVVLEVDRLALFAAIVGRRR
jgi:hypothetical protein